MTPGGACRYVGMPWKEKHLMSIREDFVLRAREPGANKSALCREFGISRKTGHKWIARYEELGLVGLEDMARRPHQSPLKVDGDLVAEVIAIRRAHPRWGAKKIAVILRAHRPRKKLPTQRTIARILVRTGFIQPLVRRQRSRNGPMAAPKVIVKAPNDVWTVDFKGWWLAINHARCEPLTIRDAFSRFVLRIAVLPSTGVARVRQIFEEVFTVYGLPKAILTDNGIPFAICHGQLGLTTLSAWWWSLGIEHVRTRPGKPADNGGHERMHRDMAEELEAAAALDREAQQRACDRWRYDFNQRRPHEALGMKTPAAVYRRSAVHFDRGAAIELTYPERFRTFAVGRTGMIVFRKKRIFLSHALHGYRVGLAYEGGGKYSVWLGSKKLGVLDWSTSYATFLAAA